ncbi:hypothetical protein Tco_1325612 [Tanacetum coccineum]
MTEQIKVWFLREVASEDCFAEDLRDQCSQVRANMEKMMLELERLRGRRATLDCLDRLRLMQNVEKQRMWLEARVGTHEIEFCCSWMISCSNRVLLLCLRCSVSVMKLVLLMLYVVWFVVQCNMPNIKLLVLWFSKISA